MKAREYRARRKAQDRRRSTRTVKQNTDNQEGFSGLREIPLLRPEKGAAYGRTDPRQYHHDTEERTDHRCGVVFQSQRHRNIPRQAAQSDTCRQLAGRSRAGKNGNLAIGQPPRRYIPRPGRFLSSKTPFSPSQEPEKTPAKMPLSA